MKTCNLKSVLAVFIIVFGLVTFTKGGTFMVCSGTEFTLTAGGSGFSEFEWKLDDAVVGTAASLTATHSLSTEAASAAITKVYSLRAKDEAGCWSNVATHTVYILPIPKAIISDPHELYCSNENVSTTLTASAEATTGMPAGIDYTYTWSDDGSGTDETLSVTAAGKYTVTIAYDFTGVTNDGTKATCTGSVSHTITPATAPTAPSVTLN
jgi:hypothetical protein